MNLLKTFLLVLVASAFALLAGCQTVPEQVVQPNVKYTLVKPSADLLKHCDIVTAPPDRATYLAASPEEKERMLTEFASSLLNVDIPACNKRWDILLDWYAAQEKVYGAAPPAPAATP